MNFRNRVWQLLGMWLLNIKKLINTKEDKNFKITISTFLSVQYTLSIHFKHITAE